MKNLILLIALSLAVPAQASKLVKVKNACQALLRKLPFHFHIDISVQTDDTAKRYRSTNAGSPGKARYRLNELTRVHVRDTVDLDGVTRIYLSPDFPDAIRVVLRSEAKPLLAAFDREGSTLPVSVADARDNEVTIALEITADPNYAGFIEAFRNGIRFDRSGSYLRGSSQQAFAYAMTGTASTRDFLFAGLGLTRGLIVLPDHARDVVIFKGEKRIYAP